MSRKCSEPWLRRQDNCYYTTSGGRPVKLGAASLGRAEIERRYHALHAAGDDERLTLGALAEQFTAWTAKHRSAGTAGWYADYLPGFLRAVGPSTPVDAVTPADVDDWVVTYKPGSRYNAGRAAHRLFNWAVQERIIEANPVRGHRLARQTFREFTITTEQQLACIASCTPPFDAAWRFLWETGCRPQEMRLARAEWVQGDRIVFPATESKGNEHRRKRKRTVIYLNETAQGLVESQRKFFPSGNIFRNRRGERYTKNAVVLAVRRLRRLVKIPELVPYTLRHTHITNMLIAGVPIATVAILHNTSIQAIMLAYEHVVRNDAHLVAAVRDFSQ